MTTLHMPCRRIAFSKQCRFASAGRACLSFCLFAAAAIIARHDDENNPNGAWLGLPQCQALTTTTTTKTIRPVAALSLLMARERGATPTMATRRRRSSIVLSASSSKEEDTMTDSSSSGVEDKKRKSAGYQETDSASKGFVSGLTNLINAVMDQRQAPANADTSADLASSSYTNGSATNNINNVNDKPPTSLQELRRRIQDDYQLHNYLWTGDLDLPCFEEDCLFQDPTLAFQGRQRFVQNVQQNLVPLTKSAAINATATQSILLQEPRIMKQLKTRPSDENQAVAAMEVKEPFQNNDNDDANDYDYYVQTRWNMVGQFNGWLLFWKPRINVVGNTKFWFRPSSSTERNNRGVTQDDTASQSYSVYFYDEEWELPAYEALLQLLTPGGE